ncbi:hypothetical protein, partial [Limosilactobacillus fermentum]|uniref:hypothetical protein n=1 Tax=Limosilactobacillus fermentum TaxID=1613 RepID=UPI0030062F5D
IIRGRLSLFQYPQGINLHKIFYTPQFPNSGNQFQFLKLLITKTDRLRRALPEKSWPINQLLFMQGIGLKAFISKGVNPELLTK